MWGMGIPRSVVFIFLLSFILKAGFAIYAYHTRTLQLVGDEGAYVAYAEKIIRLGLWERDEAVTNNQNLMNGK